MNLFDIVTVNASYRETLFSSTLNYLMDPGQPHQLKTDFLVAVLRGLDSGTESAVDRRLKEVANQLPQRWADRSWTVTVNPEETIETAKSGRIDSLILIGEPGVPPVLALGLEVKVFDGSADTQVPRNERQLNRYHNALCGRFGTDFILAFLVPAESSIQCRACFKHLLEDIRGRQLETPLRLLYWKTPRFQADPDLIPFMGQLSIGQIVAEFSVELVGPELGFLLRSLIAAIDREFLPEEEAMGRAPRRFPDRTAYLANLGGHRALFEELERLLQRSLRISPTRVSIGVPYARNPNDWNTLFRILTTTDYLLASPATTLILEVSKDLVPQEADWEAFALKDLRITVSSRAHPNGRDEAPWWWLEVAPDWTPVATDPVVVVALQDLISRLETKFREATVQTQGAE